jgi:hypothetical protein
MEAAYFDRSVVTKTDSDFIVAACNQAERIEDALQRVNGHRQQVSARPDQPYDWRPFDPDIKLGNIAILEDDDRDLAIEDRLRSLR